MPKFYFDKCFIKFAKSLHDFDFLKCVETILLIINFAKNA